MKLLLALVVLIGFTSITIHEPNTSPNAYPVKVDGLWGYINSDEFEGSINQGQLWRKPGYTPGGIMDPYND